MFVALEVRQGSQPGPHYYREAGEYAGKTIYHVFCMYCKDGKFIRILHLFHGWRLIVEHDC